MKHGALLVALRPLAIIGAASILPACASFEEKPIEPRAELEALLRPVDLRVTVEHAGRPMEPSGSPDGAAGEPAPAPRVVDPTDGLDEAELVAVALARNPEIRARRLDAGQARSALISAGLWPDPEVGFTWRPGLGASGHVLEADALVELANPWERAARRTAAENRIEEALAGIAAAEWDLVAQVRARHAEVLFGERKLALLEEEAILREQAAALVRKDRDAGNRSDLDAALADLELAEALRDRGRARAELNAARRELWRLLGLRPDTSVPLVESGKDLRVTVIEAPDDDTLRSRILGGRFELRAAEAAYRAAEEDLRAAVQRQYPRLKIGPSYGREFEGDHTLGLGLALEVPAWNRNRGEIAEKEAERDRLHAGYSALLHGLLAEAFDARGRLADARADVERQEEEVLPLLERSDALAEGAFRARELSLVEWVSARERALRARLEYLDSLLRYRKSLVDLEAAMGESPPGSEAARP